MRIETTTLKCNQCGTTKDEITVPARAGIPLPRFAGWVKLVGNIHFCSNKCAVNYFVKQQDK